MGIFQPMVLPGPVVDRGRDRLEVLSAPSGQSVPLGKYWRSNPLVFPF